MPFELLTEFPRDTWTHSSGGEHALKQSGDIGDINALRIARGDEPLDSGILFRQMYREGVVTLHELLPDGGAGDAIGYIVADKSASEISVEDFYVVPERRGQGIGGALLGNLIQRVGVGTPVEGLEVHHYSSHLTIDGQGYDLPGNHLVANGSKLGDQLDRMIGDMPAGWSGMRTIYPADESPVVHEVFSDGDVAGTIDQIGTDAYVLPGSDRVYPHIAFAAINLLNERD